MESVVAELPPSRAPFGAPVTHSVQPSLPAMFAVISWGCAGTKWTALALNSHPDVFCVHSANYYLHSMAQQRLLDGVEYLRLLESIGTGHEVIGEVHGISRESIAEARAHYGSRLSVAVLVREPFSRLRSQVTLTRKLRSGSAWDNDYQRLLARQAGLDPDQITYEQASVVHAADMLNRIVEERAFGPIFTLEALTQSRAELSKLLEFVSAGRAAPNSEWLDHVNALPRQNAHRADAPSDLTPAELEIVDRIFSPEARACYRSLGYQVPD